MVIEVVKIGQPHLSCVFPLWKFSVFFPRRFIAILWILFEQVWEQTGSNTTYYMAINRLGNLTGKKKHTTYLFKCFLIRRLQMQSEFFSHSNPYILFYFESSVTVPLVIILGRLPLVRDFPFLQYLSLSFASEARFHLSCRSLVKNLKIEVMPILYIDCLDCKMTTLNAPFHLKAYNYCQRIYNYLILEVWWHQVKTSWLGEQARWREFCVLISYRVCYEYSLFTSLPYSPGGGGYSLEF